MRQRNFRHESPGKRHLLCAPRSAGWLQSAILTVLVLCVVLVMCLLCCAMSHNVVLLSGQAAASNDHTHVRIGGWLNSSTNQRRSPGTDCVVSPQWNSCSNAPWSTASPRAATAPMTASACMVYRRVCEKHSTLSNSRSVAPSMIGSPSLA